VKYLTPFRLATYLLVVFCIAHTAGGMLGQKSLGPEADVVFSAMKRVHFDFNGADATYYGFWFAFGLMSSVFLLFSAFASWRLASLEGEGWRAVEPIAWALFLSHVANAYFSWAYFFSGPGVLATLIALLMGAGALGKRRAARGANA
jgi:hypothetical protein